MNNSPSKATKTRRRWWLLYTTGILLTLTALAAGTSIIITLDRTAQRAATSADRQASLRLALWRLDAWLSPLLAQESAKVYYEYQARSRWDRMLSPESESLGGDVSPLHYFESKFIPLHFQISPRGVISSPQLPTEEDRRFAGSGTFTNPPEPHKEELLRRIMAATYPTDFAAQIEFAESNLISNWDVPPGSEQDIDLPSIPGRNSDEKPQRQQTAQQSGAATQQYDSGKRANIGQQALINESQNRNKGMAQAQSKDTAKPEPPTVNVGPFIPIWLAETELTTTNPANPAPLLAYIRRVQIRDFEYQQGFILDWNAITIAMQNEITDLFPSATLAPVYTVWGGGGGGGGGGSGGSTDPPDLALAVLPATLVVPELVFNPTSLSTPTRLTLILTYTLVLFAVTAIGIALKGGIAFGDKRNRFASAVTHELRTPLTTFRMYSEMLAQDMVPPGEQKDYLNTLEREARRLESLVNNVLAYARLEEGHPQLTQSTESQSANEILERFLPTWQSRAADAGLILEFNSDLNSTHTIQADPEAVGQIIFNLIENACKYGQSEINPTIQLNATAADKALTITISDHGPGIDPTQQDKLFRPFERAHNDPTKPGLGLGLSLARSLAQDLQGTLTLDQDSSITTFRLNLPLTNT